MCTPPVLRLHNPPVTHFGDAAQEYHIAREGCALFDLSDRTQIEMRGKDAGSFLHRFCTNDIQRLSPGEGCEAFVTNIKGRILAHIFVFATSDGVWIDSPSLDEEQLITHFDRYLFREDVALLGRSQDFGDLYVAGAASIGRLVDLGVPVDAFGHLQHAMSALGDITVAVRRIDFWDRPGFLISADRASHVALWDKMVTAGMQPAGSLAFHAHRIQHQFPWYGLDLSTDNLAQEAKRNEQAISFTKGCYLGQEPIARIDALGHINRQVAGLHMATTTPLGGNLPITTDEGDQVGQITSSVAVPGQQETVALALLRTGHANAGTQLRVQSDQGTIDATVCG
jgi:folate-binding protein YgfZ